MEDSGDVRPLSAVLETDGSIEVELAVQGQDEPQSMTIEASKATKLLVIPARRAIDLEEGDETDALVRRLITERIGLIKKEIARRQSFQTSRQR
jgi:hypothetical protein